MYKGRTYASFIGFPCRFFTTFLLLAIIVLPIFAEDPPNDNDKVEMGAFEILGINGQITISPPLHIVAEIQEPAQIFSVVLDTDRLLPLEKQDGKAVWNVPTNWGGIGSWENTYEFYKSAVPTDLWTLTCNLDEHFEQLIGTAGPTEKYVTLKSADGSLMFKMAEPLAAAGVFLKLVGADISLKQFTKFDVSLAGNDTVLLNQNATIENLSLESSTKLEFDGARSLAIQNEFHNDGTLIMASGSSLNSPFTITNNNTIRGSGTINPFLLNETGSLVSAEGGTLNLASGINNKGILQADGGTLPLNGTITNSGRIEAKNGGTVQVNGAVTSTGTGVKMSADGGTIDFNAAYTNDAAIEATNGSTLDVSSGLTNNTTISATQGSTVYVRRGTLTNNGTMQVSGSGSVLRTEGSSGYGNFTVHIAGSGAVELQDHALMELRAGHYYNGYSTNTYNQARVDNDLYIDDTSTLRSRLVSDYARSNDIYGDVFNEGKIDASHHLKIEGTLYNNGKVVARDGGRLYLDAPKVNNVSGNQLVDGIWECQANSSIQLSNASLTVNSASIDLKGSGSNFSAINGLLSNPGSFCIGEGRNFTTVSSWDNSGTLEVCENSIFSIASGHDLINTGEILGEGTIVGNVVNSGAIEPGGSPGILSVTGDYFQDEYGSLLIEIGGTDVGLFDVLNISKTANLAGILEISMYDGFLPEEDGLRFDILTCNTRIGEFDSYVGLTFNTGYYFDVEYLDNGVSLVGHVPEPSTFILFGIGLAFLRKRRAI